MTAKLNFEQMGMFGLRGEPNTVKGEVLRDVKEVCSCLCRCLCLSLSVPLFLFSLCLFLCL
eukprot:COSAG03_NODE_1905_length_3373_cov_212.996029_3_plen_61_part_00